MPKDVLTVRDLIENFLENIDIKLEKNEEYEKVMGWYAEIIALPKLEYRDLLYIKDKYYASQLNWTDESEDDGPYMPY